MSHTGQYEDVYVNAVAVSHDKEKLEKFGEEWVEQVKSNNLRCEELTTKFEEIKQKYPFEIKYPGDITKRYTEDEREQLDILYSNYEIEWAKLYWFPEREKIYNLTVPEDAKDDMYYGLEPNDVPYFSISEVKEI